MAQLYITFKKIILLLVFSSTLSGTICLAQYNFIQYFDGDDTLVSKSVMIKRDTSAQNVWQIGKPQKILFNRSYSAPNVLITDTLKSYPVTNTSSFTVKFPKPISLHGGYALQWVQKLDMDSARDGGIIEVSIDTGKTWQSVFNNPNVYNFFGYASKNILKLTSGESAFSGRDTTWRDVWLCYNLIGKYIDTIQFRFTFKSDSIKNNMEGWMIDNMSAHITMIHPVTEVSNDKYLNVYPRLTNGIIYISPKLNEDDFKIQNVELLNELGQAIEQFKFGTGVSSINLAGHPSAWYYLRVNTTHITKTYSIWLNKY